jgi:hypothetical protein
VYRRIDVHRLYANTMPYIRDLPSTDFGLEEVPGTHLQGY